MNDNSTDKDLTDTINDFLNYKNETKENADDTDPEILDNRSLSPNANEMMLEEFSQRLNLLDSSLKIKNGDPNANTPPPSPADHNSDCKINTVQQQFHGKFLF